MKRIGLFATALLLASLNASAETQDMFFRSGRYNVVVGVLLILFVLLFVYLVRLDRKVSRIEKEINEK